MAKFQMSTPISGKKKKNNQLALKTKVVTNQKIKNKSSRVKLKHERAASLAQWQVEIDENK